MTLIPSDRGYDSPLQKPKFIPPVYDSKDGSYSYFGGDFKTWNVPNDQPGKFTSRQLFKAGSPHTVSIIA